MSAPLGRQHMNKDVVWSPMSRILIRLPAWSWGYRTIAWYLERLCFDSEWEKVLQ